MFGNKKKAEEDFYKLIEEYVPKKEILDTFMCQFWPSFYWVFVIGPLFCIGVRGYYIVTTKKGVNFIKLGTTGKEVCFDFMKFGQIESLKVKKGILSKELIFKFYNNREIKLKYQKTTLGFLKMKDETIEFLENNIGN